MKTPLHKKIAAFAVALALAVSGFGFAFAAVPAAHAESSDTVLAGSSEARLIALLEQLIDLLKARIAAMTGGSVDDEDDDRGHGNDDDGDDDDNPGRGHDDDDDDSCDDKGLEIEATIFNDETVVEVEIDGEKDGFTTSAESRSAIEDEIKAHFSELTSREIEEALVIEEEDRNSRASDKDWDDDDNSCDDDDDSDDDDDEDDDDDNRGHGNGHDDDDDDEDDDD